MSTDRAEEAPHVIRLHDLRKRVDHAIQYRAECSCGWMGTRTTERTPKGSLGETAPSTPTECGLGASLGRIARSGGRAGSDSAGLGKRLYVESADTPRTTVPRRGGAGPRAEAAARQTRWDVPLRGLGSRNPRRHRGASPRQPTERRGQLGRGIDSPVTDLDRARHRHPRVAPRHLHQRADPSPHAPVQLSALSASTWPG